jgi:hypothetical protein
MNQITLEIKQGFVMLILNSTTFTSNQFVFVYPNHLLSAELREIIYEHVSKAYRTQTDRSRS